MKKKVSIDDLKEVTGLSRDQLLRKAKQGIVVRVERGLYDICATVQNLLNKKEKENAGKINDYFEAKKRYEAARAQREELKLDNERAEVIDVAEAMESWGKVLQSFRARTLAYPRKTAPLVYGCKTIAEAEAILEKEIYQLLTELANPDLIAKILNNQKEKRKRSAKRK